MKTKLTINNRDYHYYPLEGVESLPYSLRILYPKFPPKYNYNFD